MDFDIVPPSTAVKLPHIDFDIKKISKDRYAVGFYTWGYETRKDGSVQKVIIDSVLTETTDPNLEISRWVNSIKTLFSIAISKAKEDYIREMLTKKQSEAAEPKFILSSLAATIMILLKSKDTKLRQAILDTSTPIDLCERIIQMVQGIKADLTPLGKEWLLPHCNRWIKSNRKRREKACQEVLIYMENTTVAAEWFRGNKARWLDFSRRTPQRFLSNFTTKVDVEDDEDVG